MIQLPKQVQAVIRRLNTAGYEAWLVGGSVRDAFMGKEPHDFDMATSALPDEVMQVFCGERVIETGLKHGTVTVLMEGMPLEITTFRAGDTGAYAKTLREDLTHRDLTMNAIAYNPDQGFMDPFGGRQDIERGLIRCVENAEARILEDPLRMLRAARFSSVFGFAIERETQAAMEKHRERLRLVSAERLASELVKLLCGRDARRVLLEQADLLGVFIPELLPMKNFDQRNHHHIYDVFTHTAVAVENVPAEPALRLAMLFHDIGKPAAFQLGEDGEGHFHGHARLSTQMADEIIARLKLDNLTRERVTQLIRYHDHVIEPSPKAVKRMLGKLTPEVFDQLILIKRADNLAQHPDYRGRQVYLDELVSIRDEILQSQQCFSMKDLALNGRDLIAMGMKPGPDLGKALEQLLEAVIEGEAENTREALAAYLEKL